MGDSSGWKSVIYPTNFKKTPISNQHVYLEYDRDTHTILTIMLTTIETKFIKRQQQLL